MKASRNVGDLRCLQSVIYDFYVTAEMNHVPGNMWAFWVLDAPDLR